MIFINERNYSYLLKNDCSIVITGDSLAYNRYDFVDEPRMNAYDCPLGMQSWSFLLRDFLIRSTPGWKPASSFEISGSYSRVPYLQHLPFAGEGIILETNKPTDIHIKGCPEFLYFITDPSKGALFEIEDKFLSLKGNPEFFEGYSIEIFRCHDGILKNVREDSRIILIGGANTRMDVHLTGSGSKTAEWLISNSNERILRYKPSLCIMIIGANNRRMKDPESFKGALKSIIEELHDAGSEIVLVSPPHSSTTDPPEGDDSIFLPDPEITKPILDATYELATKYNITMMNLFEFFSGYNSHVWRFDNTHFTKTGNFMLFEALKGALFERGEK